MWNGGAAAYIVSPTIYLPAGSGAHIPTGIPPSGIRARPSQEPGGTPHSEAGSARAASPRPGWRIRMIKEASKAGDEATLQVL
jgi:hypothetical protein